MLKPAFSTVACPEWPLETVFANAARMGYLAVELRTFGDNSRAFVCDPALTAPEKIRGFTDKFGVQVAVLGTGIRFDAPVSPPVLGHLIGDNEKAVREGKRAIDLAATLECPFVRVFAYEAQTTESRAAAIARLAPRIAKVADHAHRTGVKIVIENGGSFQQATQLAAVLDAVGSPLVGACYNVSVGHTCGEKLDSALNVLGERLWVARVKDTSNGLPCRLGEGEVPVRAAFDRLRTIGFDGPVVFEYDRAWIKDLEAAEPVLGHAAKSIFGWIGADSPKPAMVAR